MGDTIWLAIQALGTFVIVMVVALWSSARARQMLTSRWPRKPSALARATPDPQFKPDPEVTDPFHVTDAHRDAATAPRSEAGGSQAPDREAERAHAASLQHPSGVERLDGIVQPVTDGARQDGADATIRPGQAR